jgi:hypothetical protein
MVRSACSAIMLTMSRLRRRLTFSRPVAWSGSGIAASNLSSSSSLRKNSAELLSLRAVPRK